VSAEVDVLQGDGRPVRTMRVVDVAAEEQAADGLQAVLRTRVAAHH
jgi:hypothetical protein